MLTKTMTLAAVAALLTSGTAEARTWWILDFGSDRCVISQYSPDEMIQSVRNDNRFSGPPEVTTYPVGSSTVHGVSVKAIYATGNAATMLYFDTPQYCQNVRQSMKADGVTTDRGQLQ